MKHPSISPSELRFSEGAKIENVQLTSPEVGLPVLNGETMALTSKTLPAPLTPPSLAANTKPLSCDIGLSPWERVCQEIRSIGVDLAYITAGCILFVIGMNSLLIPQGFVAGGLAGAALLLSYSLSFLDVGWWYLLLNIPLMVLGWWSISRRFLWLTLFGMVLFSVAASRVKLSPIDIQDPIMAAIAAGVICGAGAGLVLRSRGSAGGLDILSVYLRKKWGFSLGSVGLAMNGLILAISVWMYSIQVALYSALFFFVCSRIVDAILRGINPEKVMLVISDEADAIASTLMTTMKCGVTFLKGEGGFEGKEKKIIYSIVRQMDIPRLKTFITDVDPGAFIVINHSCEASERRTFAGIRATH